MVFKGFTDENGNVIPVQGAGTVYNEEKNSLALGRDTSAIGQDQLVFGRRNIEDADKAELVGGGGTYYTLSQRYNFPWRYEDVYEHVLLTPIGTKEDVIPFLLQQSDENLDKYIFLNSGTAAISSITNNTSINILIDDAKFYLIEHTRDFSSDVEAAHPLLVGIKENNGVIDVYWITGIHYESYTGDRPAKLGVDYISFIKEGLAVSLAKNIRTLDWEGNEELAGSLTVGTGITIGETSLSEAELIALKALLNS